MSLYLISYLIVAFLATEILWYVSCKEQGSSMFWDVEWFGHKLLCLFFGAICGLLGLAIAWIITNWQDVSTGFWITVGVICAIGMFFVGNYFIGKYWAGEYDKPSRKK